MKEINKVMNEIEEAVGAANAKMGEIIKEDGPFTFDEVRFSADNDSAGIYVHSGNTPVCAVARAGSPEAVVREVKAAIDEMVVATKNAIDRRGSLKADAAKVKEESCKLSRAIEAMKSIGLDPSLIGPNEEAAKAIADAAKKAIADANKVPLLGAARYREQKMTVEVLAAGMVVRIGKQVAIVTSFPRMCSNKTVEKTIKFITADIAALDSHRRAYFTRLEEDAEKEAGLRELAERIDAAYAEAASM